MSVQSPVGSRRFTSRRLSALLSLAMTAGIAGGSLLWAEAAEFYPEATSVVVFRAKPSMSRQPRPLSAPLRHFDLPVDAAVKLVGIESTDDVDVSSSTQLPMGEWTPRR